MHRESEAPPRPAWDQWQSRGELEHVRHPQPKETDRSIMFAGLAFTGIGLLTATIAIWQQYFWRGEFIPGNTVLAAMRYVSPMALSLAVASGFVARRSRVAIFLAGFTMAVLVLPSSLEFLHIPDIPRPVLQCVFAAITFLGGVGLLRRSVSR